MKKIPETFDHRLAFELAQGFETPETIYPRYGLSEDEWDDLRRTKEFRLLVEKYLAEMQKDGTSFRNKAGILAEDLLYVAHSIASNPDVTPAMRMEALQWLAKVSGKDESTSRGKGDVLSSAPPFMINIDMRGAETVRKNLSVKVPDMSAGEKQLPSGDFDDQAD